MNIYLLKRNDKISWDEYAGMVIAADSEDDAIRISVDKVNDDYWYREKLTVSLIGTAIDGVSGILLTDYLNG